MPKVKDANSFLFIGRHLVVLVVVYEALLSILKLDFGKATLFRVSICFLV